MESKDKKTEEEIKLLNKVDTKENFTPRKKSFTIGSFLNVIKYSMQGYAHFYRYERSAILHLIVAIVIILGSLTLHMTAVEWLFMIFILLTMLAIELLNTAIEAICDLVSPGYNKLVKVAKDTASAATFSISIALCIAIVIIYVPKFAAMLGL